MCNPFIFNLLAIVLASGRTMSSSTDPPGPIAALESQFPYMVSIRRTEFELMPGINGIHICAGALITKRLVLTAAHCIFDMFGNYIGNSETLTVVAGSRYINASSTLTVQRIVTKVYVHPAYTADTHEADLALLILDKDVDFNSITNISAVAIPNYPAVVGDTCIVLGWNNFSTTQIPPNILQYYVVQLHPYGLCQSSFKDQKKYLCPEELCACPTAVGVTNNVCYNGNLCNSTTSNNDCLAQPPSPVPKPPPLLPPQHPPPRPMSLDLNSRDCYHPPDRRPNSGDPGSVLVCNNKITGVLAYSHECKDIINRPQLFTETIQYIGFLQDPDDFLPEMWQYLIHDDAANEAFSGGGVWQRFNLIIIAILMCVGAVLIY